MSVLPDEHSGVVDQGDLVGVGVANERIFANQGTFSHASLRKRFNYKLFEIFVNQGKRKVRFIDIENHYDNWPYTFLAGFDI